MGTETANGSAILTMEHGASGRKKGTDKEDKVMTHTDGKWDNPVRNLARKTPVTVEKVIPEDMVERTLSHGRHACETADEFTYNDTQGIGNSSST